MALKKITPAFENESSAAGADTAVAEKPGAAHAPAAPTETAAPAPSQASAEASAKVESTTAIAKAANTSVGAVNEAALAAKNFKKEVEAMFKGADFSYGSHRVFKAKDGILKETSGDKVVLGKWLKGRLLAWDRHFEISPGEDGKSSGEFVAYSLDGVTIDNVIGEDQKKWEGQPVQDYLKFLREEEEFDKAASREFVDLQVAAMGSEEEPDFSGVVQLTLSSSSIPSFKRFQSELEATAKCVAMNLPGYKLPENPFDIFFIREAAERGKNSWTKIRLSSTLPAKV